MPGQHSRNFPLEGAGKVREFWQLLEQEVGKGAASPTYSRAGVKLDGTERQGLRTHRSSRAGKTGCTKR